MRAGKLRKYVTLYIANAQTRDDYGGFTDSNRNHHYCWAEIEPLSSRELYYSQQVHPTATHKVTLRFDPGVTLTHNDYVVFNNRRFNIVAKRNLEERDATVELMCEEVQA